MEDVRLSMEAQIQFSGPIYTEKQASCIQNRSLNHTYPELMYRLQSYLFIFKRLNVASIFSLIGRSVLNTLWKQAQKRELMQSQKKKVVFLDEQGPQTSFADSQNYFGSRQDQKGPSRTNKFQQNLGLVRSKQTKFIGTNVQA